MPTFLPCPFCGEPPHYSVRRGESLWSHDEDDWHSVRCPGDCGIEMQECRYLEDLEKRWNRRRELAELREKAAKWDETQRIWGTKG